MTSQINPFIVGGPVPPECFIGRRGEVKTILDRLAHSARGSTAISGERLIGKTSLLHYISDPKVAAEWGLQAGTCKFILTDSQTIAPFTPLGFWQYVLKSLAARNVYDPQYINDRLLNKKKIEPFELSKLFDHIAEDGKLVVLLLDEFEHVVKSIDPDNPEFLDVLRSMANRPMRGLALITASREPLHVLCRDIHFKGSPFQTGFTSVPLEPFSLEEANQLIENYTRDTRIRFSRKEKEGVYEVSKGHPYQLQREYHKLFDQKAERRWFRIPIRELITHRLSKAFITIGLVASTILLVFVSALWYQYIYPETIAGTQITPDNIGYSVGYPEWIGVGDTEQFRIALTNEGTQPLSNVKVYLDFSDTATVVPPLGCSLTADVGTLHVRNTWADKIEFCLEKVSGIDIVQTDLLITSDELDEKLLDTYTFKVIDVPYMENLRGPKNLIRQFLGRVGALAGAFLMAFVGSWAAGIASSRRGK